MVELVQTRKFFLQLDNGEVQEFCSERYVLIRDDFRFCPSVAVPINIVPANEKIPVPPVAISQVLRL